MLEFLESGDTATTKGLFIPISNLPNSFTEDYLPSQDESYKNGRFLLSVFNQINKTITGTDFLIDPNEDNKLAISSQIIPLRIDRDTEDRIITYNFTKLLNTKTNTIQKIDLGEPIDDSLPTGLFDVSDIFSMGQVLNVGDQVGYVGGVISETVLLANGLSSLNLATNGFDFIEALIKSIISEIPSQFGGVESTLLPYTRPRVQLIANPLASVSGLFDGIETITSNVYIAYLSIAYSLTIRMAINSDRVTVISTT